MSRDPLLARYGWFFAIPVAFLGVVAWVYRPGASGRYRKDGQIPLDKGDAQGPCGWVRVGGIQH